MSAVTTRSSFERCSCSRYCASSDGRYCWATLDVSQRWYLPRSNWLSVWNSGIFWNSGGGEFRIASTISSSLTVMPRRRYSASSTLFWTNWSQTSSRTCW